MLYAVEENVIWFILLAQSLHTDSWLLRIGNRLSNFFQHLDFVYTLRSIYSYSKNVTHTTQSNHPLHRTVADRGQTNRSSTNNRKKKMRRENKNGMTAYGFPLYATSLSRFRSIHSLLKMI